MAPTITVTKSEAQYIAVLRAIKKFGHEQLIDETDLGDAVDAIKSVLLLDELEEKLSGEELEQLIFGFVAGLGASKLPQLLAYQEYEAQQREFLPEPTYSGGPTGGVIDGQGQDPRLVTQTGPKDDS